MKETLSVVAKWTDFIDKYEKTFSDFMKKNWYNDCQNKDKDDFREAWIEELHNYLAGNTSEDNYGELYNALIKEKEDFEKSNKGKPSKKRKMEER